MTNRTSAKKINFKNTILGGGDNMYSGFVLLLRKLS